MHHIDDLKTVEASKEYFNAQEFQQQYIDIACSKEFISRPQCHVQHALRDKLVAFNKLEKCVHTKLDTFALGTKKSKNQSYYESIQRKQKPSADMALIKLQMSRNRPINTFHEEGKELQKKLSVAKSAQRDQMIHSYRDRLFTRFKV